jgi:steroid 5-alpha reductase family enzyme
MWWILLAYIGALAGAVSDVLLLDAQEISSQAAVAYFGSVFWIFAFSAYFRNSSVFDPFWSVAPPLLIGWLAWVEPPEVPMRAAIMLACISVWAVRLTLNWARGFGGMKHEDWRYIQLKQQTGAFYWLVSLLGIHLFPAVLVWLGCLSAMKALGGGHPLGPLDGLGVVVCLGATAVEAVADEQLRRHRQENPGKNMETGLWAWSRHPNYLGEIGFWWGLFLFSVSSSPANAWTVVGPLSITVLFWGISIPMMEKRLVRREGYSDYQRRVSMLLPFPPRR